MPVWEKIVIGFAIFETLFVCFFAMIGINRTRQERKAKQKSNKELAELIDLEEFRRRKAG